jgi:transposase
MELISPLEAAKRLKKHKSTVYRMIERGEVKTDKRQVEEIGVLWDGEKGGLVKPE